MSTSSCIANFTQDALLNGRVALLQPRNGYRAAIDPVLLAAAIPAKSGENAVELGLGSGAASLCLLARCPELLHISGLELDQGQAELAQRNAEINRAGDRLLVILGDAAHPPKALARNHFDHVLMNPPYLEAARHDAPAHAGRATAHVEATDGLKDWIKSAGKLLKQRGRLTLIHRADRLDHILAELPPTFGSIAVLPIWPRAGEAAKRVIVQAIKGGKGACRLLPGLVLHDEAGYTSEADAVLRGQAALDFA
jgi:tRNA1(Val) A37 N6-methylase TrmN6